MPKRILIENQNAGFGVDTVVPIVRVDPVTIPSSVSILNPFNRGEVAVFN